MPALNSLGFQAWITLCAQSVATVRCTLHPGPRRSLGLRTPRLFDGNHPPTAEFAIPELQRGRGQHLHAAGMFNMTSHHPGGANILMCDGSVRFLKNSVNMPIVWAWARARKARSSPPTPIELPAFGRDGISSGRRHPGEIPRGVLTDGRQRGARR